MRPGQGQEKGGQVMPSPPPPPLVKKALGSASDQQHSEQSGQTACVSKDVAQPFALQFA